MAQWRGKWHEEGQRRTGIKITHTVKTTKGMPMPAGGNARPRGQHRGAGNQNVSGRRCRGLTCRTCTDERRKLGVPCGEARNKAAGSAENV